MIDQKPTPLAEVSPGVPKLLQQNYLVRFSDEWPQTMNTVRDKLFVVKKVNVVSDDLPFIIPGNDFVDVDMSNSTPATSQNIYPDNYATLYEVALGFKPGAYIAHFYIPLSQYVSRLEQATMVPDVTVVGRRYIGARKPEDSPYNDPRIFLYFVKDLDPLFIRLFVEPSQQHEKCILGLTVNKCYLVPNSVLQNPTQREKLAPDMPVPTAEQISRAKILRYYTELRW